MRSAVPNESDIPGAACRIDHAHIGLRLAVALLAEQAEVTLLIRPDTEERLTALRGRVQIFSADLWDSASLRGRARGHQVVIHTVGSMVSAPQQGLTYHA
ncbi:SDR family oxidoreductase [bacterium]|nr:SDR family oxidoreductase [bacterium]